MTEEGQSGSNGRGDGEYGVEAMSNSGTDAVTTEDPWLDGAGGLPRGGALVVVATPIGNMGDISSRAIEVLSHAAVICCEDTRHSGRLLKRLNIHARRLLSLHEHNEGERAREIVERIGRGELIALISDAGTPAISDPGAHLVASVIAAGGEVTTVPGPSAVIAALVVSGLPTDRFTFEGFLPRRGGERHRRLQRIAGSEVTTIVYESPVRVRRTLAELEALCGPTRTVVIARELTKLHEELWRGTLGESLAREESVERGEHVLVLGPNPAMVPPEGTDVIAALQLLKTAGLARRDAVSAVELLLKVRHRVAYQAALDIEGGWA